MRRTRIRVAFFPSLYTSTFGCSLLAAVTGQAMVGPPRRKRVPMDHRLSAGDRPWAHFLARRAVNVNVPAPVLAAAVTFHCVLCANPAAAESSTAAYAAHPLYLFGIPVDFILFGLT